MSKALDAEILEAEVAELSKLSYDALKQRIGRPTTREVACQDGKTRQVSVDVFWDDAPEGDLRVIVGVDDKGWRALFPRTSTLVVRRTEDGA